MNPRKQSIPEESSDYPVPIQDYPVPIQDYPVLVDDYPVPVDEFRRQGRRHTRYSIIRFFLSYVSS